VRGAVPSQYRLVGPKAWPGARDAILSAPDRIVYAISGGKHLRDIKKGKRYGSTARGQEKRAPGCAKHLGCVLPRVCARRVGRSNSLRTLIRIGLLLLAIYAVRNAMRRRRLF